MDIHRNLSFFLLPLPPAFLLPFLPFFLSVFLLSLPPFLSLLCSTLFVPQLPFGIRVSSPFSPALCELTSSVCSVAHDYSDALFWLWKKNGEWDQRRQTRRVLGLQNSVDPPTPRGGLATFLKPAHCTDEKSCSLEWGVTSLSLNAQLILLFTNDHLL